MASESREDLGVGVDVPAELGEWLDDQAATLGVDREQLVVQILSSYHAAATLDGHLDAAQLLDLDADDFVDVETAVGEAVDEQVADAAETVVEDRVDEHLAETLSDRIDGLVEERVATALDERLDDTVDELLDERADDLAAAATKRVEETVAADRQSAIDELDSEFQTKIADVRERVIQVKQEADAKAPKAHVHEELAAVDALDARVSDLVTDIATLRQELSERIDDVEAHLDEHEDATADLTERVDDAAEKLNRVGWVVSDLKEETSGRDAYEQAVDRIRRAAAQEGVSTATCERCDEAVHVALLNDPECPHCQATVSDVRPTGGLLRKKARLVAASQLEAGEDPDS